MDKCKNCDKAIQPGNHFCSYCNAFAYNPEFGKKAGLFKRWFANSWIDPLAIIFTLSIAYWIAMAKGTTPGHAMLGMKFVKSNGEKATFGTMFLREVIGKLISGLFFGLGFYWAIWDKDHQTWHDKIAGTYVLEK
ncbi:MAG: RDD family protein [Candidatus Levyibacteriota bacterium]